MIPFYDNFPLNIDILVVICGQMLHRFDRPGFRQIMLMPGPCHDLEACDAAIATLGFLESQTRFEWSQVANQISLHFVTSGSGCVTHRRQRYELQSGDAFCFFPGETYHYEDNPDDRWTYTWFALRGKQSIQLCNSIGFNFRSPVKNDLAIKPIQFLIDEIEAAYRSEDHSQFYPHSAAWRIFDRLSSNLTQNAPDQLAHVLRRILDTEFTQADISISQIAKDLRVDRSTLFRHFQRVFQVAPKQYLESQRMHHAEALIRGQQLSIKDIALRCGYEDAQYFSRVFRKHFNCSPSQMANN